MAVNLANYTELKAEIAHFINRSDLTDRIPTFIGLAELDIERDLRKVTTRDDAFTIDAAAVALPSDCAELRSLRLSGSNYNWPITFVSTVALADRQQLYGGATGVPRFASVVESTLLVAPAPSESFNAELIYYTKLTPLTDSQTTNAVLTTAPDLYLFGALVKAAAYLEHDERVPLWKAQYDDALARENIRRERAEFGAPQLARLPRVFG